MAGAKATTATAARNGCIDVSNRIGIGCSGCIGINSRTGVNRLLRDNQTGLHEYFWLHS